MRLTADAIEVVSPWDGRTVGHVPRGRAADVHAAVAAVGEAQSVWAGLAPSARERALLRAADHIEAAGDTLAELVVWESGSTWAKARHEVAYGAELLRAAAGEVRRLGDVTLPSDRPERLSFVLREPLGVVGVISPFNAPLALFLKMVAFPLAAGNGVVAKPSEATPLVAREAARVMALPVLRVVTGLGAECGAALVAHPDVAGLAFTGSTATGRRLAEQAGRDLKRVQLELGGHNAVIVLADADPDEAAHQITVGAFAHAGQICMSASRVLVERPLVEPLIRALVARAEALPLGTPDGAYGPLIHADALAKVQRHVDEAVDAGARLATGGRVLDGLLYAPTVLVEPPRDSTVWREETFGPVVSVAAVDDLREALARANDSDYGLSAGVLTRDVRRGLHAARRLRVGSVHVGAHPFQSDALAPIGGRGASGIGRSGGRFSIEHFTEPKWVTVATAPQALPF